MCFDLLKINIASSNFSLEKSDKIHSLNRLLATQG